jgi:hypothetical protein
MSIRAVLFGLSGLFCLLSIISYAYHHNPGATRPTGPTHRELAALPDDSPQRPDWAQTSIFGALSDGGLTGEWGIKLWTAAWFDTGVTIPRNRQVLIRATFSSVTPDDKQFTAACGAVTYDSSLTVRHHENQEVILKGRECAGSTIKIKRRMIPLEGEITLEIRLE